MNKLIFIIKQEGLSQNKVTVSLASFHNRCKVAYREQQVVTFAHASSLLGSTC